jgi:hypothetical protein
MKTTISFPLKLSIILLSIWSLASFSSFAQVKLQLLL